MSKQNLTIDTHTHTNACKLMNTHVHKVQNIVAQNLGNIHTHTHIHEHVNTNTYTRRYTNIVK